MLLEFGRPQDYLSAITRIPSIADPQYGKDYSTTECANFREYFFDITNPKLYDGCDLITRSVHFKKEVVQELHQANSFRRSNSDLVTYQWSRLDNKRWAMIFPLGDDNYRWWQLSKFEPSKINAKYTLYCVEMNKNFLPHPTLHRFDNDSFFNILIATENEVKLLNKELSKNNVVD